MEAELAAEGEASIEAEVEAEVEAIVWTPQAQEGIASLASARHFSTKVFCSSLG